MNGKYYFRTYCISIVYFYIFVMCTWVGGEESEERSSGGKLTKAAAEQRAAGDNNHYNETGVSLLKYLCTENSPSQCMSTEDNLPFQHQPLLGKVFTFSFVKCKLSTIGDVIKVRIGQTRPHYEIKREVKV